MLVAGCGDDGFSKLIFEDGADGAVAVLAGLEEFLGRESGKFGKMAGDFPHAGLDRDFPVAVSSALGLRNDFIDQF